MHFKYVENTDNVPTVIQTAFGLQATLGSLASTGTGTCVNAWLAARVYAQTSAVIHTGGARSVRKGQSHHPHLPEVLLNNIINQSPWENI